MKAIIYLTDGFEEMEAVTPADILRRGGVETELVSLTGGLEVTGSHGITVRADRLFEDAGGGDMLVLPGGPGAAKFISHSGLTDALVQQQRRGGYLAAICAAPVTLGKLGLLKDRAATCYPGMEGELNAAAPGDGPVVTDGNIITGRGPGAAADFGLVLLEALAGSGERERVEAAMAL